MPMPRKSTILVMGLLVLAVVLIWPAVSEFLAVDRCLDAGGSFNYLLGSCDLAANHPYLGVWERHGLSLGGAVACAVVAFGILVYGSRRGPK